MPILTSWSSMSPVCWCGATATTGTATRLQPVHARPEVIDHIHDNFAAVNARGPANSSRRHRRTRCGLTSSTRCFPTPATSISRGRMVCGAVHPRLSARRASGLDNRQVAKLGRRLREAGRSRSSTMPRNHSGVWRARWPVAGPCTDRAWRASRGGPRTWPARGGRPAVADLRRQRRGVRTRAAGRTLRRDQARAARRGRSPTCCVTVAFPSPSRSSSASGPSTSPRWGGGRPVLSEDERAVVAPYVVATNGLLGYPQAPRPSLGRVNMTAEESAGPSLDRLRVVLYRRGEALWLDPAGCDSGSTPGARSLGEVAGFFRYRTDQPCACRLSPRVLALRRRARRGRSEGRLGVVHRDLAPAAEGAQRALGPDRHERPPPVRGDRRRRLRERGDHHRQRRPD